MKMSLDEEENNRMKKEKAAIWNEKLTV